MNNIINHIFGTCSLVRLFIAIDTRPITIPNPKNPQITSTTLNFDNIFAPFQHYLKNNISLDTISTIPRIHASVTRSCVKVTCGNSFCSHTFTNLKEKLDHSISQVLLFFGVML